MIVLTAYGSVTPDKLETALAACRKNRATARTEKGCLRFDFFINSDDPNSFVFVEEWESREDLEAHFAAAGFGEFMSTIEQCLSAPPEMRIFESTLVEG